MKKQKISHLYRLNISKKNWAFIIIWFLIVSATSCSVSAHTPSAMTLSYNLETHDLRVTITHQVTDPTTHYIAKVDIKKNGAIYNTSLYSEQPDSNSFTYTYKVNATLGDVIEVTISCNQGGSKTVQHTITQGSTDNGKNETSTPGFELSLILGGLFISFLLMRKKRN